MIDKRPRIIDVMRKPQKCPVCGERVVDIIYGTGDMTEIEFLMEYRREGKSNSGSGFKVYGETKKPVAYKPKSYYVCIR